MNADDLRFSRAVKAYESTFGEDPDFLWMEGDADKFVVLLEQAVSTGKPLPDYYEANGISPDALV
ncbi:MAG: hypothetical protein J5I99_09030 [Verrucomicrobia bacterium]|nr:hypothetical protein [Verrucomicrobiota bacterium]